MYCMYDCMYVGIDELSVCGDGCIICIYCMYVYCMYCIYVCMYCIALYVMYVLYCMYVLCMCMHACIVCPSTDSNATFVKY